MIRAVLVTVNDLSRELRDTLLYRSNVDRMTAPDLAEAKRLTEGRSPDVVVVDSDLPNAAAVVAGLRADPITRGVAIVALGRSEFGLDHLDLIEAGANAILPLPPGPNWDDRLMRLVHVPVRKSTRLLVNLAIEGGLRSGLRFEARAVNISINGMLLDCRQALDVGDDLRLQFELPVGGPVRATGTVVRQSPPTRYGVEITSAEGDGRQRIKRYVESGAPD